MDRQYVNSSSLVSVGYDVNFQTLEIEFQGGRIYQYFDVPVGEHEALMSAPSHGQYFAYNIRNNYRYAQL